MKEEKLYDEEMYCQRNQSPTKRLICKLEMVG